MKNIRKMKHVSLRSEVVDNVDHQIVLEMACENGISPHYNNYSGLTVLASGIIRSHRFLYQDSTSFNAVFDATEANRMTVEVNIFKQLLEQVI